MINQTAFLKKSIALCTIYIYSTVFKDRETLELGTYTIKTFKLVLGKSYESQ